MMTLTNVGEIIAVRNLHFLDDDEKEISVLIGKPQQFMESSAYYCPFQIIGIGAGNVSYVAGLDAVQALQFAMAMIGAHLYAFSDAHGNRLRWNGSGDGLLGFPPEFPIR